MLESLVGGEPSAEAVVFVHEPVDGVGVATGIDVGVADGVVDDLLLFEGAADFVFVAVGAGGAFVDEEECVLGDEAFLAGHEDDSGGGGAEADALGGDVGERSEEAVDGESGIDFTAEGVDADVVGGAVGLGDLVDEILDFFSGVAAIVSPPVLAYGAKDVDVADGAVGGEVEEAFVHGSVGGCCFYTIYYYFMVQRYGEKIDIIETARGCGQSERGG